MSKNHEILLFSDLHLHEWSFGACLDKAGFNTRLTSGLNVITQVFGEADERSIPLIVFTGDLFHSRQAVSAQVLQRTTETIASCVRDFPHISLILMLGNHDFSRDMAFSFVNSLRFIPHVTVISDPRITTLFRGEISCLFLPYTPDKSRFEYLVRRNPKADVIFAHQGFGGLSVDPRNYYIDEVAAMSDIQSWASSGSTDLISGHYHDHALLTDVDHLGLFGFFVGAPQQQNFGDVGCDRGFVTYELGSRSPVLHPFQQGSPLFLDVTEETPVSEDVIQGNFVRCIASTDVMLSLMEHVKSLSPAQVTPKYLPENALASSLKSGAARTHHDKVRAYVSENGRGLTRQTLMDMFEVTL